MNRVRSAAIVGAGLAGLACARRLATAGVSVALFDKGTRAGGRMATRRVRDDPALRFDHGAQYATARDEGFRAVIAALAAAGVAAPWPAASHDMDNDPRWVGVPDMAAIPLYLQHEAERAGVTVATARQISFLYPHAKGWQVRHADAAAIRPGAVADSGGELAGPFDTVLLAIPAPQAHALLHACGHPFARDAASVGIAPCWAAMLAFPSRVPGDDVQRPVDGPLRWIARQGSRPGHAATSDHWVAHANPAWSCDNLERDTAEVAADLNGAFAAAAGCDLAPSYVSAHRWRYALVETPLGRPCLWDGAARIGVCGDWCLGARVEAAWLSGTALADSALGVVPA